MSAKQILFDEEARNALRDGVRELCDVVSMTLGPLGLNVGLDLSFGSPSITSDGASIAQDVELKNPFLNMGVLMGREVATKIKEISGDGTTTGIVLLNALVKQGLKNISAGANPLSIKRGMEKALEQILAFIDKKSLTIASFQDTKNIATVSASNRKEIGEIIATCFEKAGKETVVVIEEGKGTETAIELVEGMQIDRGYLSPYFVTNGEKLLVEMDHPYVLITDKKISSAQEILGLLQQTASSGAPLLIIAEDIEGDAISTLVVNKLKGTLKVAAIKAPAFGDLRKEILEDLAILTQGEVVSEEKGLLLKELDSQSLGMAERVVISREKTTIIGKTGKKEALERRLKQIQARIETAGSLYDKKQLLERKAKLQGGIALIRVGAMTETEMKKTKQLFEDSLNATKAALEEGIVPGGGVMLFQASRMLPHMNLPPEELIGAKIVYAACEAPFRQIVQNSGREPSLILEEAFQQGANFGFNAETERVEDLLKAGVQDPAKVVKNSLIHAVSMAGVILLTESLIAPEEEKA